MIPAGEQKLLRALADVNVEMFIFDMIAAYPTEANSIARLDPCGIGLVAPEAHRYVGRS